MNSMLASEALQGRAWALIRVSKNRSQSKEGRDAVRTYDEEDKG